MNKSKFLKKSLAAILSVLLVVAMIPLSAAAAPTLSGASVSTDISGTQETILTVDDAAGTITGNISLAAKSFTLYILPRDNTTGKVSVSYEDVRESDKPVKGDAVVDGDRWKIGAITFTRNDFLVDDNTVQMKVTVQNDDTREQKEYTVTLNRVADPSDPTITSLRVWTMPSEIQAGDMNAAGTHVLQNAITSRVPQLNATNIDQVNKIIDITVPFNTKAVWVRDFELVDGAKASISVVGSTTVDMSNEAIIIKGGGTGTAWGDAEHTDPADGKEKDNIAWIPVKVTAGTHTADYTLRLTRASGIESFTVQNAIDSRVFPGEGKVVVVMPFGYTNDNADNINNTLTVVPEFSLQYSDTNVPSLVWDSKTLKSGETKINFDSRVIVLNEYDYTIVTKRLQNAKSYVDWAEDLKLTSKEQHTNVARNKLTVTYVEDTSRVYEVIVVEPKKNYEAKIDTFDIGNESATIDETTKTINITLPTGTDLTKVAVNSVKIFASDAATVTLPMYKNVTFVENTTPTGHDDHASTNLDRSVLTAYTKAGTDTIDCTNPITVRVKSQDGSTTADYTLTVKASSDYVKPAVTSLTLQSADGKTTLEGKLDESTGIFTVEVPYSFKTTEDLKDYKLFYGKTVGCAVSLPAKSGFTLTGTETFLSSASKTDGTYFDIVSNSKDASTKGAAFTAKVRNPFTNQMEEENFYILLVRKAPSHVSTLKSLDLTSNGTKAAMDIDEVNEDNTYTGTIKGADIEVKLPWSHYEQQGGTDGGYQETHIADALRVIAETTDENATAWIRCADHGSYARKACIFDANGDTTDSFDWITHKDCSAVEIIVLSEQLSVDLNTATLMPTAGAQAGMLYWAGVLALPQAPAKTDYTVYKLSVKQDDAKVSHVLNSIKLVAPSVTNWNVDSQELQIQGNTITGSIPFSMVGAKIYLDYAASPRAFVLGGENSNTSGVFTTVKQNNSAVDLHNAAPGYPNSAVGHFCDYSIYEGTNCGLLPNSGAYIKVAADGTVTMYDAANTDKTTGSDPVINKLIVTSEDTSKGVGEYTFDLTVRPASKENLIKTFEVEGQVGSPTINNETDTIDVTVASTVELTALKTKWTLSDGATLAQTNYVSGNPMNFSTERLFTVVAENGTSTRTYRVNVKVQRGYTDVQEGVWYYDPIMYVTEKGWMTGKGAGVFDPMGQMTRAEFAAMIAKMDTNFNAEDYTDTAFPDVTGWAVPYIKFCAEKEYILGSTDGNFHPDDLITREQAAIIMCKVKGVPTGEGSTTFADNNKIADWSVKYVNAAVKAGIFQGVGNNEFAPQRTLMRCEAAQILVNCDK